MPQASTRLMAVALASAFAVPARRVVAATTAQPEAAILAADSEAEVALERAAEQSGLRRSLLQSALEAYHRVALTGTVKRPLLTVIDFGLPSHERRLWVLDPARGAVLAREFVAHGRGSGDDVARRFSNREASNASSLGTFLTGGTYQGRNGLSLRLLGLDPGVNDRALARAIVMHGAWYVSEAMIRRVGRLGRSDGCPALSRDAAPRIIGLIAGGSVLYAGYEGGAAPARPAGIATRR